MPDKYFLSKGAHSTAQDGRCAMEWVAYLAGEPHSDSPECVSPALTVFCVAFNDGLDDENRQRLRPYLARSIGTRGDGLDEQRSWMATDWLIRTYMPAWLSLAGLDEDAARLRALPPVLAAENLECAMVDLGAARQNAAAAGFATGFAAGFAAWDAAGFAADAAWDAAWFAAGATAGVALTPTVRQLQDSAFELLDRMLPTVAIQVPVVVDAHLVCGVTV